MAVNFDRDEVRRGLLILYPPGHGVIELDVLKKTGGILPGHFDDREKLLDEIEKYDSRADVIAIYTSLNLIKPEAFKRSDHQLSIANKVASGLRIDAEDVGRVTGILFDIDPFRANGDKKDSTTYEEHQAGIEAADFLKHKLSLLGWPEPVMGSSGNGATLRYLTDLPAAVETEDILSRMLKAANGLLPEHLAAQVEVDGAMFDRPRISKVFGTTTRKGAGTQERPHRRSRLISAPEKLEPVQLDGIMKLIAAGKNADSAEGAHKKSAGKSADRVKPLSDVEADSNIKPCLKAIILNKDIKQLEEVSAHEHKGRVAIATELVLAGYSDDALHEFFSRLADYDRQKTAAQLNQILNKFIEGKGGKTWLCETLRDNGVIPAERCAECKWLGHGQDPLIILKARIKADPRALKEPAILAALAELKTCDPIEYDLTISAIKKAHSSLKVETINSLVDAYILAHRKTADKSAETPKSIMEKARAIAERGDPFKFLIWQAQRNHLGDVDMHKVLISSTASASSETSHGLQPGNNGDSGSGKDDACEAVYHLVPSDRKLDGSLSPMSLFYLEKDGLLKPGMILYSDDVEYLPIIPIYKRSSARFQKYTNHYSVSSGKERTGLKMTIPPRMVWWMTSVESVANLEAFGRLYPTSTDSSPGHKKRVTTEIAARRARTELKLTEDEGIAVARAIIADIFDNGPFKVLIPQAKKAKWLKTSDFRGQEQFWDLVDAQVVLHWRQRKKDENGWLIAEDRDLIEAKEIHTGHKVAHFSDLTEAEAKVVGVMSSGRTMTQKELTEALELAQSTLSIRLKSIMAKSAIITEDYDQGKKVYSINPKMNLGTDYWKGLDLIELGIDDSKTYCSQMMPLLQSYCSIIGVPIAIIIDNSNRIPSSLLLNMDESMRDYCSQCCGRWSSGKNNSSSHISAKTSNNDQNKQQEELLHYNKQGNNDQIDSNNDIHEPTGTTIRQASDTETKPTMGPTPNNEVPDRPNASEVIRVASLLEFGYNGSVDPAIVAGKLHLSEAEVSAWLEANYVRLEKPGDVVRYTQRKAEKGAMA